MEGMTATRSKYDCLLFDMDDTLYPMSSGLNLACRKNIIDYMRQYLHIEESVVAKMCLDLYKEYGTTMAGLKALGYEFDDDEFHAYVHGRLPYDNLKPDPVLRNLLLSMPQRKIIFTNADKAHAAKVLSKLGLEDCFEGVICFETLNPPKKDNDGCDDGKLAGDELVADSMEKSSPLKSYGSSSGFSTDSESDTDVFAVGGARGPQSSILCKPNLDAMEAAIQIANVDPKRTIFFDDSARNIASGKAAGLHTFYVGSSVLVPGADFALESIHNIKVALPEIWECEGEGPFEIVVPVETTVLA